MSFKTTAPGLKRKDNRIIIHFDYDCFYASVFEAENPALKSLPLGVQQKQIIVTCNYEARRRGCHKLQLIADARKICPDIVIVLGENLDRFRNASKLLYKYLEGFTWNNKVERLGLDEVWLDVSDLVDWNEELLNGADLEHSWFQLDRLDPTNGFAFDARSVAGPTYPDVKDWGKSVGERDFGEEEVLARRLMLGSHLAYHVRRKLEEDLGYTSTVGISTSKLLSKLAGNVHKPKNQTTLMPPYSTEVSDRLGLESNVQKFIDEHDIGKIPGIGFRMAQKLRTYILGTNQVEGFHPDMYNEVKDPVKVSDVRTKEGMGPELLEKIVGGPGTEKGIGSKAWALLNGIDDTEVQQAKRVPTQISIEDSYGSMATLQEVKKALPLITMTLLQRMHIDLVEDGKWLAYPKTLRLSTRPRLPPDKFNNPVYFNKRVSRSAPLPSFVFSLSMPAEDIVQKLVMETLIPMFRKLHTEKGWNLSLMNVAVTNMVETATEDGRGGKRDIASMFSKQEENLKLWKVPDIDVPPSQQDHDGDEDMMGVHKVVRNDRTDELEDDRHEMAEPSAGYEADLGRHGSEDSITMTQETEDVEWIEEEEQGDSERCERCGALMPGFAMAAHERFHLLVDDD